MNNEIIEFLLFKLEQNYKCEKEDYFILYKPDIKDLLDYITNLQQRIDKASEYILDHHPDNSILPQGLWAKLLDILKGDDE